MTPIPAYNLAHEAVVAFDTRSGHMSVADIGTGQQVVLSQRGQLLLLDALCCAYGFESPVADVVKKVAVADGPEGEE